MIEFGSVYKAKTNAHTTIGNHTTVKTHKAVLIVIALCTLVLPPGFSADLKYQIKPGDTLYSIARQHGISHESIMQRNNIADVRSLRIGEEIIIPSGSVENIDDYEIQGGDTLYSISRRTGMSVQDIIEFNNLNSDDVIRPGQVIQLRSQGGSESGTASANQAPTGTAPTRSTSSNPIQVTSRSLQTSSATPAGSTRTSPPAPTPTTVQWPHGGERLQLEGKFPGIAIRGEVGDPIRAVSSGRVVYSGPHSTLANVVFIQNGRGYIYIYGGNSRLEVGTGDEVQSGQVIGSLGPSPLHPEVQVYFSAWKDGSYTNPATSPR